VDAGTAGAVEVPDPDAKSQGPGPGPGPQTTAMTPRAPLRTLILTLAALSFAAWLPLVAGAATRHRVTRKVTRTTCVTKRTHSSHRKSAHACKRATKKAHPVRAKTAVSAAATKRAPAAPARTTTTNSRITASKTTPASTTATTTSTTTTAAPHAVQLGFNTYTSSRALTEEHEVGASLQRLFVDWSVVEASQGSWDWSQSDDEYRQIVASGIRPLLVAFAAPCWARPSTDCSNPSFTGPPDASHDSDWTAYIKELVQRYPQAAGVEVWNEPNLDQLFLPKADPVRFTQLLQEAYTTVKSVAPSMPVISGALLLSPALGGSGIVPGGYGAPQFLTQMYAHGAASDMDALGVHVYPSDYVNGAPATWDPAAMTTWMDEIDSVRNQYGHASVPEWITEMGVSTATESGWPAAATPTQQATDLQTMLNFARTRPAVQVAIVHTLEDQSAGYADADNSIAQGWGLFTSAGGQKPAACAVSKVMGGSLSC
jgi:polysaccharide biosynthesis protein PslG